MLGLSAGATPGETENRGRTGEEQLKSSGVRFVRDGELLPWNLAENLTARRAKGGVLQEALRLRDKSTPQPHRQANTRRNNRPASHGRCSIEPAKALVAGSGSSG